MRESTNYSWELTKEIGRTIVNPIWGMTEAIADLSMQIASSALFLPLNIRRSVNEKDRDIIFANYVSNFFGFVSSAIYGVHVMDKINPNISDFPENLLYLPIATNLGSLGYEVFRKAKKNLGERLALEGR